MASVRGGRCQQRTRGGPFQARISLRRALLAMVAAFSIFMAGNNLSKSRGERGLRLRLAELDGLYEYNLPLGHYWKHRKEWKEVSNIGSSSRLLTTY